VIRAAVYPAGGELDARVYGERARDMRLLLYDGGEALATGMGVSLSGGTPEYRIVSMEGWSHQRALLERIPEGLRAWAINEAEAEADRERGMEEARQAAQKPAPEQPMPPMAAAQPGDAHAHRIEMLRRLEARMCCGHNYHNRVGMKRVRAYLGIGRPTLARMLERHNLELGRSGSSSGTKYWVAWGDLLRVLGVDETELTEAKNAADRD
jgi:hypothetical protein